METEEGTRVPIVDGIPRFCSDDYAKAFGEQWHRFQHTQVDSLAGNTISRDRLWRALGKSWNLIESKVVLEIGAGAGRFTEILAQHAAIVYATDLSSAIEVTALNTRHRFANVRYAQCDALALPFANASFDTILVLGVIQHTPDPIRTAKAIAKKLRPGGYLVMDFYRSGLSSLTRFGAHLVRSYLLWRNDQRNWDRVHRLFGVFDPIHRVLARKRIGYLLLTRLSPIVTYYHASPETPANVEGPRLSDEQKREWGLLNTHDGLTDRYKHLFTDRKIRKLCRNGLVCVELRKGGNGFELIARRDQGSDLK